MPRTARAARRSAVVAIEPDIDGDAVRMLAQTIVDRGREVAVLLGHVATAVHLTERRKQGEGEQTDCDGDPPVPRGCAVRATASTTAVAATSHAPMAGCCT